MHQEPTFIPRPGQVDYTHVERVPVVDCIVEHEGKVLLVKRSQAMRHYPGRWHCVAGYLDDHQGPIEKAKEELAEEAGIGSAQILAARAAEPFEIPDHDLGKTWVVHPVFFRVASPEVTLNWESEDHRWVTRSELSNYHLLNGFAQALEVLFEH